MLSFCGRLQLTNIWTRLNHENMKNQKPKKYLVSYFVALTIADPESRKGKKKSPRYQFFEEGVLAVVVVGSAAELSICLAELWYHHLWKEGVTIYNTHTNLAKYLFKCLVGWAAPLSRRRWGLDQGVARNTILGGKDHWFVWTILCFIPSFLPTPCQHLSRAAEGLCVMALDWHWPHTHLYLYCLSFLVLFTLWCFYMAAWKP